jgi:hypothetical protein
MKRLALILLLSVAAGAQVTAPQIPLTGNIGAGGNFPLLNSGTLVLAADANHPLVYPETSALVLKVTSSVALTATRTLVAPLGLGFGFTLYNDTTGGQTLGVCGTSGTCAMVPNDGLPHAVSSDGINYYSVASSAALATLGNCSSPASPAVCGSAQAGSVAMPVGAGLFTVNTSAVTANSQIFVIWDQSLGTKLGVSCQLAGSTAPVPVITARTAGSGFQFQLFGQALASPGCFSYFIIN